LASSSAPALSLHLSLPFHNDRAFNDVFQHRTMWKEIEVLEHKTYMLAQLANQVFLLSQRFAVSMVILPTRIVPLSGCSSRLILRNSVVLPDPLGQ
jgi:hypothetical protein